MPFNKNNMKIENIDKNFKIKEITDIDGDVYNIPNEAFYICGGWYENDIGFIKMPLDIANKTSTQVLWGSRCTAGVRALFSTDAKTIKLHATIFQKCLMNHMPLTASAGFTLCKIVNGKEKFVCNFIPSLNSGEDNMIAQADLNGNGLCDYILYFPLYSGVKSLALEFNKGARIQKYNKYKNLKPILYYGSSITQGGCASRTDNCYQSYISQWTDIDYFLLGYSGGARAEKEMREYLSQIDCSVFVCDYDHNAPSVEHLENTHLELYKNFRSVEKNKLTPIIFLTKPDGDRYPDGAKRVAIIRKTFNYARKNGDFNVYFIDGRTIYPEEVKEHCAVDGCHPTDLGFYFIAKKLFKVVKKVLNKQI